MTKNTGKPSEEIFDTHFTRLGKRAYVHKFTDASEVTGMNKGRVGSGFVNVKAQPADRLVVLDGQMFFAEVKSSTALHDRFDFKLLKKGQNAAGAQAIAAGGAYWVYYHHIATGEWFRFPSSDVLSFKAEGCSSINLEWLRATKKIWTP